LEFTLAAIARSLRRLAKLLVRRRLHRRALLRSRVAQWHR
jgi:hypothetical protein